MTHEIRFYRTPSDGTLACRCSCGFTCTGDAQEVRSRAATHDLDDLGVTDLPAPSTETHHGSR